MMDRLLKSVAIVATMTIQVAAQQSSAATTRPWTAPLAQDGHPDLQGTWINKSATPLERPIALEGRQSLTDDEVNELKKRNDRIFGAGRSDDALGDSFFQVLLDNPDRYRSPNSTEDSLIVDREFDNRTSLITDPPDGRLPAMTAEGQKRRDATFAAFSRPPAGPEDRGLQERCITFGSPQLLAGYQSYYQIVQTSNAVVFLSEMIHDARVIPLDGRPHAPSSIREWNGDSRGHWEGDTLVIDTLNYKPKGFMASSSEKLHVIERFSRTGPETLKYEITIDDPETWTKPWSLMIPLRHSPTPIYEYACHEGNVGMVGILAGARAEERAAAGKPTAK